MSENTKITKLLDKLDKAKAGISRAKEQGEQVIGAVTDAALTVAGGVAVGALRGYAGGPDGNVYLPGTHVQADLAAGVLLVAAGVSGVAGKNGDKAIALGSGMLAVIAAEKTQAAIKAHASHAPRR